MNTRSDRIREAVQTRLAANHLQNIYQLLDLHVGKMNVPTKEVDEYELWDKLKADPTIKISERFLLAEKVELVVIERIKASRK